MPIKKTLTNMQPLSKTVHVTTFGNDSVTSSYFTSKLSKVDPNLLRHRCDPLLIGVMFNIDLWTWKNNRYYLIHSRIVQKRQQTKKYSCPLTKGLSHLLLTFHFNVFIHKPFCLYCWMGPTAVYSLNINIEMNENNYMQKKRSEHLPQFFCFKEKKTRVSFNEDG